MSVPWSSLTNGGSNDLSAPGPPCLSKQCGISDKRREKVPKKLSEKLQNFANGSSNSDFDNSHANKDDDWDPMKDDFKSPTFNSYTKGPGAQFDPPNQQQTGNYVLFVDRIPVSLTRDGLNNLFSRCGKVTHANIVKNDNQQTTFGFIEYATLKEADAALQQMNNFEMGKGIRLKVQVSDKSQHSKPRRSMKKESPEGFSKEDNRHINQINDEVEVQNNRSTVQPPPRKPNTPPMSVLPKGRGFSCVSSNPTSSLPGGMLTNCIRDSIQEDTVTKSLPAHHFNSSTNNSNTQPMTSSKPIVNKELNSETVHCGKVQGVKSSSSCNYCGGFSSKKCAVCRTSYCSLECQSKDWATHKHDCKSLSQMAKDNDKMADPGSMQSPVTENEDAYQELNDLCQLMKHVDVQPSALVASRNNRSTPTPPPRVTPPTTPSIPPLGMIKGGNVSYRSFNAAFGTIYPLIKLPVVDLPNQVPSYFYGFVCMVMKSCRIHVFPLHEASKQTLLKFLKYEEQELSSAEKVSILPDHMQIFGYKCSEDSFQRVEVNSSSVSIHSYDSGYPLGTLDKSRLFVLPNRLSTILPLYIKVAMFGLEVKQQTNEGKNFLVNRILGKVVKIVEPKLCTREHPFVAGTVYSIDDKVDYNELLASSGYVCRRSNASPSNSTHYKTSSSHSTHISIPTPVTTPTSICHKKSASIKTNSPPLNIQFEIFPTSVISPGLIWAQVFHECSWKLELLLEDMNTVYQESHDQSNYVPSVGELCAARFSDDNMYYRAEVVHFNNNGLVDVQFVDYGNKETVSCKNICPLQPRFLNFPKQAVRFALHGIKPIDNQKAWSSDACAYVQKTLHEQKVCAKIIKKVDGCNYLIVNHPERPNVTINDEMVLKGLAENVVSMKGIKDIPQVSPRIGRGSAFNHASKHSPGAGRSTPSRESPLGLQSNLHRSMSASQQPQEISRSSALTQQTPPAVVKGIEPITHTPPTTAPPTPNTPANKQHVSIPTITLPVESKDQMIVVHVEHPQLFYLMPVGSAQEFVRLSEEIQSAPIQPVTDVVNIGDFYLLKYSKDNCYSRVEVLKLKPNKALVRFVDYGNKQAVLQKDLCVINEQFCSLAQQAIPCSLHGVSTPEDGKWSKDTVAFFSELAMNKCIHVAVMNVDQHNNIHEVNLVLESIGDVAGELISKKHATSSVTLVQPQDKHASSQQHDESTKHTSTHCSPAVNTDKPLPFPHTSPVDMPTLSTSNNTSPAVVCPSYNLLDKSTLSDQSLAVVASVIDTSEFYIQVYNDEIKVNVGKVVLSPSEFSQDGVTSPLGENCLCFAKFAEDGQWYRARVVASDGDKYRVQFIDFGNYADVLKSNISLCPENLYSIPILAIKCSLYGVTSKASSTVEMFKSLTHGKVLFVSVVEANGDKWMVSLIDTSSPNDVDIASCLNSSSSSASPIAPSPQSIVHPISPPVNHSFNSVTVPGPVLPAENDHVQIMITEILSPSKFYGEFLTNECLELFLGDLCTQLPAAYSDPSVYSGFNASVNSYCCAKFSLDNSWYRCKVLGIKGERAKLLYIDYGNTDIVALKDLYHLDPKFASVPAQAILCALNGIAPVNGRQWSHESIDYLKTVSGTPLHAVVKSVKEGVVYIDLYQDEECTQSISDALLKSDLAIPNNCQSYKIPSFEITSETLQVVVSDFTSFDSFYVQVALADIQRHLVDLQASLGSYAKSCATPSNYKPKIGDFCCALFKEDNCWYRAVITGLKNGRNFVEVVYVDFGNTAEVGIRDLRPLTEELADCSQVACKVALSGLDDPPASSDVVKAFQTLTSGKILNMKVTDNTVEPIQVELYESDNQSSINSQLLDIGKPISKPVAVEGPVSQQLIEAACLPEQDHFKGMMVHIESCGEFYLQVTEADKVHNLIELMESIAEQSKHAPPISAPGVNSLCLAQFSGDFYRGRILEISGEHARVHFIDYGNTDVVHVSDIKVIPAELLGLPAQALKCSLVGISANCATNSEASKKFASIVANVEIICNVVCKHPLIVDIKQVEGSSTASQILAQDGFTSFATNTPFEMSSLSVPTNDKVVVMVTEVEKPNILWMQVFNKATLTDFEKVIVDMNSLCEDASIPSVDSPLLGQLCCAKFQEDSTWYRGRVVGFNEDKTSIVQFIDFGNSQVTSDSSMKGIPQALLHLPAQGIPCLLNGYNGNEYKELSKIFLNKHLNCIYKGLSSDGMALVDLFDAGLGVQIMPPLS